MPAAACDASTHTSSATPAPGRAMALVTLLFFLWGFLTVLNDVLVPHFRNAFTLNYAQVMLIQFAFFIGYVATALPAGKLVKRIGYQRAMVVALVVAGGGALLFVPAASAASYPVFLAALFVLSAGITTLQVACNPYVAALGTPETAPSRLNLSQAFNSLGAAIAPWLGGMLILSATTVSTVKGPYLAFAAVLFGTAVVIGRARLPLVARIENQGAGPVVNGRPVKSAWRVPHLVLGAVAILLYCGAEVSIGSFLVNFLGQPEIGGLSPRVAARYASYYWTAAMIGRFAGSALLRRLPAGKLLGVFGIAASLLVWIAVASTGAVALWSIVLVGLFNSIMFPTIFTLAIDGLGRLTSQGSGILFLAVLGPAVLPVIQGALADRIGIQNAFVLPALCYLYVVYYGFRGCRERPPFR